MSKTIDLLEYEWTQSGFLGRLREGVFDHAGYDRFERLLRSIQIGEREALDRRFVSLIWYVPCFMLWQRERVKERGGNVKSLDEAAAIIQNLIEEILGVP